jgi:hypothetical protein
MLEVRDDGRTCLSSLLEVKDDGRTCLSSLLEVRDDGRTCLINFSIQTTPQEKYQVSEKTT